MPHHRQGDPPHQGSWRVSPSLSLPPLILSSRSQCLGHGDFKDVSTPKIVEALLGEDIVEAILFKPEYIVKGVSAQLICKMKGCEKAERKNNGVSTK